MNTSNRNPGGVSAPEYPHYGETHDLYPPRYEEDDTIPSSNPDYRKCIGSYSSHKSLTPFNSLSFSP